MCDSPVADDCRCRHDSSPWQACSGGADEDRADGRSRSDPL